MDVDHFPHGTRVFPRLLWPKRTTVLNKIQGWAQAKDTRRYNTLQYEMPLDVYWWFVVNVGKRWWKYIFVSGNTGDVLPPSLLACWARSDSDASWTHTSGKPLKKSPRDMMTRRGFLKIGLPPSCHPFFCVDFPVSKKHPAIKGVPPWLWKPPCCGLQVVIP